MNAPINTHLTGRHKFLSFEHYTPPDIIERARAAMGSIDYDPCTTSAVNRELVKAATFDTIHTNGFLREWHGNVLLNPSGGWCDQDTGEPAPYVLDRKTGNWHQQRRKNDKNSPRAWWEALQLEFSAEKRVRSFVFIGFSVEQVSTLQRRVKFDWPRQYKGIDEFVMCFPRGRLKFYKQVGRKFVPGKQPPHCNVIVCGGPRGVEQKFRSAFRGLGAVGRLA